MYIMIYSLSLYFVALFYRDSNFSISAKHKNFFVTFWLFFPNFHPFHSGFFKAQIENEHKKINMWMEMQIDPWVLCDSATQWFHFRLLLHGCEVNNKMTPFMLQSHLPSMFSCMYSIGQFSAFWDDVLCCGRSWSRFNFFFLDNPMFLHFSLR